MIHTDRVGALAFSALLLAGLLATAGDKEEKTQVTFSTLARLLPTRAEDKEGTPGDMVNLVLVGTRKQVHEALTAAGWKQVDRTATEAVARALASLLQKKIYTELPMSELFLFGRPQDYGYARADPVAVVLERHHFRLWESPWQTPAGQDIWLGAGTHDVGLEEDQRNGDLTHRIHPAVDEERDFTGLTLKEAGHVAGLGYLRLPKPVREATTAHGGPFYSDGRVLVIILK